MLAISPAGCTRDGNMREFRDTIGMIMLWFLVMIINRKIISSDKFMEMMGYELIDKKFFVGTYRKL